MEMVASILSPIVVETGRLFCGSSPEIKGFIRFKRNLSALEKEVKSLTDLRNKVQEEVEPDETHKIEWHREVGRIILEVNSVLEMMTADYKKLGGCFFHCNERYKLSRGTTRLLKEVKRLLKAGNIMVNKFLLILDDVWETIDLDLLGFPQPEIQTGSKIILTSRYLGVCKQMKTDKQVKVDVLNDEEAWKLFTRNAGNVTTLERIEPLAKAVARECRGLPLAVITMGTAMRGKTIVRLWKHALNELQRSVPCVEGIEDKVYKPVKWSYDKLRGKNTKSCFLYCALFPEDFSIEVHELVRCWLAEGLLEEQENYEDSINRGIALIETLKDYCLLENGHHKGTVKMHDVVRDVAIWIASSIGEYIVPDRYLQGFPALRLLNLSGTRIQSLPLSLLQLHDLRALLLRDCFFLENLPPLGGLSKLQTLDLCATGIRELPRGMENLSNIRQLDLSRTHYLKTIQDGIISSLSSLEVLDMTLSNYHWGLKGEVEEGETSFEELRCLQRLLVLSIRLKGLPSPGSEDLTWINRLIRFQFFIGPTANSLPTKHDKRRVTISSLDLSGEWIGWFLTNASSFVLNHCRGLNQMLETLVIHSIDQFSSLKSLTIASSSSSLRPEGGCAAHYDLLPNLEELHLHDLTYLESISGLVGHLGLRFLRLKSLDVTHCPRLKYLLAYGSFILDLPNLEQIKVNFCENLVELFHYYSEQSFTPEPVVPKLRTLELKYLPKLRNLCRQDELWQSLEEVDVIKCNLLGKLPLTAQNANGMREIRGELQWWSQSDFDKDTRSSLQPFFKQADMEVRPMEMQRIDGTVL
ncbi:hypothetical protein Patl1_04360 [Pistacia atlantica]|uniref:Uncharacterized protein n=1 Tax=Pistacia atlantica TaxID=434234 RepID=A0ACC1BP78_9ROSI|nr:hypothetical protein Patl1_04360 [Pistacia atlantica]